MDDILIYLQTIITWIDDWSQLGIMYCNQNTRKVDNSSRIAVTQTQTWTLPHFGIKSIRLFVYHNLRSNGI